MVRSEGSADEVEVRLREPTEDDVLAGIVDPMAVDPPGLAAAGLRCSSVVVEFWDRGRLRGRVGVYHIGAAVHRR